MTEAELADEFDRWERKETALMRALPYFMLAVATLISLLQPLWGMAVDRAAGARRLGASPAPGSPGSSRCTRSGGTAAC